MRRDNIDVARARPKAPAAQWQRTTMQSFNTLIAFGRSPDSSNAGSDPSRTAFSGWSDSFADDRGGRLSYRVVGGGVEGATAESTMSVVCGCGGVRKACPRFIDRSLRRSSATSAPPPRPARVSAPTDCIYHPPPPHTYNYLSTAWTFPTIFWQTLQPFSFVIIWRRHKVGLLRSVYIGTYSSRRCWFAGR